MPPPAFIPKKVKRDTPAESLMHLNACATDFSPFVFFELMRRDSKHVCVHAICRMVSANPIPKPIPSIPL